LREAVPRTQLGRYAVADLSKMQGGETVTIDKAKRALHRGNGIQVSKLEYKEPTLFHGILATSRGPVLVGWINIKHRFPRHRLLAAALSDAVVVPRKELL
jgi:hypothetical protein